MEPQGKVEFHLGRYGTLWHTCLHRKNDRSDWKAEGHPYRLLTGVSSNVLRAGQKAGLLCRESPSFHRLRYLHNPSKRCSFYLWIIHSKILEDRPTRLVQLLGIWWLTSRSWKNLWCTAWLWVHYGRLIWSIRKLWQSFVLRIAIARAEIPGTTNSWKVCCRRTKNSFSWFE